MPALGDFVNGWLCELLVTEEMYLLPQVSHWWMTELLVSGEKFYYHKCHTVHRPLGTSVKWLRWMTRWTAWLLAKCFGTESVTLDTAAECPLSTSIELLSLIWQSQLLVTYRCQTVWWSWGIGEVAGVSVSALSDLNAGYQQEAKHSVSGEVNCWFAVRERSFLPQVSMSVRITIKYLLRLQLHLCIRVINAVVWS